MTDPMSDDELQAIRDREWKATEGPWAPWLDQDGATHMNGLLMVGNADGVIPDGESWVEGDVNPVAHCYTPEDREFIAHARVDVPALLAEVERIRERLERAERSLLLYEDRGAGLGVWMTGSVVDARLLLDEVERLQAERDAMTREFRIVSADGDLWASGDIELEDGYLLHMKPGDRHERRLVGPWLPVDRETS